MQGFKDIWMVTVDKLSSAVGETAMDLWIKTIKPVGYEDDSAVLLMESSFHRDIVMSKYIDTIKNMLNEVVGFEMNVVTITPDDKRFKIENTENKEEVQKPSNPTAAEEIDLDKISDISFPEYTFDNFIVGDSNQLAYAACFAVAKKPATAYNPLFLYANTGLGKTHLLNAMKNELKNNFPTYKILYIKSEDFINDFIAHVQSGNMMNFKEKYRNIDVLLVDDIQFIAGKDRVQDEFFHTFNALYESNKQIILASDRPPRDIQPMESRLRSRFESSIITDIYVPEYELKVAIIKQKAIRYNISLPDDVVSFIAQRIKNNIRQLEGVVKKLMAFQMISKSPPTLKIAQVAISDVTNENEPIPVLIEKITTETSRDFDISPDDLKGKKQSANIVFARQIAMYIMREITDLSFAEIGQQFNGRDHSTVHHSINKIEKKIELTPSLQTRINGIIKNIKEQ